MKENIENSTGFIESPQDNRDFIFGGEQMPDVIIREDSNWNAFLPEDEVQSKEFDTYGCVAFNALSQIEIYMRALGEKVNYSDRALYIMANISPPGSDPTHVYEVIRKQGLIPESDLMWSDDVKTLEDYKRPNPLPKELINKAKEWTKEWKFLHAYLPKEADGFISNETIKQALKRSPLAVAVSVRLQDGVYVRSQDQDTHWTGIITDIENGYFIGRGGYDSYPPFKTKFSKDFRFRTAKQIYIRRKTEEEKRIEALANQSLWTYIGQALKKIAEAVGLIQKQADLITSRPPIKLEPMKKLNLENLEKFAQAIKTHEGWFTSSRSFRNSNPGNLRYTELTKQLGATGKDAQNFCIFPSVAIGTEALKNFIKLAAENKLKAYKQCNVLTFFETYAPSSDNNNYLAYARVVAKAVGVPISARLSDIIYSEMVS